MGSPDTAAICREVSHTLNAFYDDDGRTPFVLSLDGGGIYGLTEAIWLRKLCEAVPGFMVPGQVRVFAGCSAGAANALLLALFESPREAVLSGVLERFWARSGVLANENPLTRMTKGLTSMFGAEDEYGALHDVFGDMTLGELPNRVLISTFNFTGATAEEHSEEGAFRTPFDWPAPDWGAFSPDNVFRTRKPEAIPQPKAGQTRRHWAPKFFDNGGLEDADKKFKVVDVALAAMSVAGIRPFRGGLGDAGFMTADPSVGAIAHLLREWERCVEHGLTLTDVAEGSRRSPREQIRRILADGERYASPNEIQADYHARMARGEDEAKSIIPDEKIDNKDWVETRGKGVILGWLKALSVGTGQALPSYGFKNFDVGMMPAQMIPFNPFNRDLWPQSMYALDQPGSQSQYTCERLLNAHRYLRLDPDILSLPTLPASMMVVNPYLKALIVRMIYRQTGSDKSEKAVKVAAEFLKDDPGGALGDTWGTSWYYSGTPSASVTQAENMCAWVAEYEAREAARIARRPWTPRAEWLKWFENTPWGEWMKPPTPGAST